MTSVDRWVAGWVMYVDAWVGEIGVKQVGRLSSSKAPRWMTASTCVRVR